MADYDASQAGSNNAATGPIARPDVDSLPAGSMGPASGNTITGTGTVTGQSGADTPGPGGASVVEVHGAGGATSGGNGNFQATGQYGVLSMDAQGDYNYVRNPGTPDGVRDVFQYTLADAQGAHSATTLTIDIGQVLTANAGIVNLPAGVELSDIHVVGRDLVIDMPDGTHMVIPNGAVFVPELSIGDVAVPATNVAALLIDSEPQPAAGNTPSSGGNFADPVPPLDPGIPLGDLIPPTELTYQPPEFKPEGQFIDRQPTIEIQPDGQPATVAAVDSVDEKGLPTRNGGEPAGSGEIADGDGSNNSDSSETTGGTIIIDSPDGVGSVMINGVLVTGQAGQQIDGEFGTLTITGFSGANILYTYTLNDNTNAATQTHDDFSVTITDPDGDQATATLTIDIVDDHPTARNDTDSTDNQTHVATGNVMTGADTTSGSAGHDTVGADDAHVTGVTGYNGSADTSLDSSNNLQVTGHYGTLVLNADGSYTYTLNSDAPGGSVDVFTYTLTDGDGSTSTATLTITNPDHTPTLDVPTAGQAGTVVDEAGLPPHDGLPAGSGEIANGDPNDNSDKSETTNGTIHFTQGDAPAVVTIDGVVVTGTIGQQFIGDHGTLTITGYNAGTGTITYSYTLSESTSGNNTSDSFAVAVTDVDGDHANSTLTINIIDDVPTAHNDTDSTDLVTHVATGNVMTGAGTDGGTSGSGVDVQGADGAHVSGVVGFGGSDTTLDGSNNLQVDGQYGSLVLNSDGTYTYTENENAPGGSSDVFTYTLTDGDGDTSTATLIITNPDHTPTLDVPTTGEAGTSVNEAGLPARTGENEGSGEQLAAGANGDPSERTDGTITFTPGDSPAAVTIDGAGLGGPVTITAAGQQIVGAYGTLYIDSYDANGTITYHYILADNTSGNNTHDDFSVVVTDSDGDTASSTLVIDIVDDVPTANNDTDSTDSNTGVAGGNVITGAGTDGGTSGSGVDVPGADSGKVSGVVGFGGSDTTLDGSNNLQVQGHYGSLVINADGTYTYTTNAEAPGGATDVFTYTLTDSDGDTSTATLTITLADHNPTVDVPTGDDAGTSVNEAGLPARTGENEGSGEQLAAGANGDPSERTDGTITFTQGDKPATVQIDGLGSGGPTTITGAGQVIHGQYGDLTIDSYNASTGTITYHYVLLDNTSGDTTHDDFSVVVTDSDGDTASATLVINIVDDVPTAHNDTDSTDSGTGIAGGNVITGAGTDGGTSGSGVDVPGADSGKVSGVVGFGGSDTTLDGSNNLQVTGHYGSLVINADGTYTYTANAQAPGGATDVFTYTLTDSDGDTSTATLTITLADHTPTVDVPTTGEAGTSVNEAGLPARTGENEGSGEQLAAGANGDPSERTDGTITFTQGDQPATVQIDGLGSGGPTTITGTGQVIHGQYGDLTIDSYNASTGTITYHYVLLDNTSGNTTHDDFSVVVTDSDGDTASATLVISIVDDVPTAHNDTDSTDSVTGVAGGNVITGANTDGGTSGSGVDVPGADSGKVSGVVGFGGSDTTLDGSNNLQVTGHYGSLVINADGTYTYTANSGAPGGASDVFTYTLTDSDGDTSTATLTITLADHTPSTGPNAMVVVDDDDVNSGGNPGGTGDLAPANTTGTLSGSGGDGTLTFTLLGTGAPSGFTYAVQGNGDIWVNQGATHVLTIHLTNTTTGAYTVTQVNPIDATGADENNVDFTINYKVTDVDGDSAAGTMTIRVNDDTPINFTPQPLTDKTGTTVITSDDALVNNGSASATNPLNDTNDDHVGEKFIGADGFAATNGLIFTVGTNVNGEPLKDTGGTALTSHGAAILLSGFGTNTLVAYTETGGGAGYQQGVDHVVFTATLNQGTGYGENSTYTITFSDTIDDGSGVKFNSVAATKAGTTSVYALGADATGAPDVDVLMTATHSGANAAVNTDATSIGVANQSFNPGDSLRMDFVTHVTTDASNSTLGYDYTARAETTGFEQKVPQVVGSPSTVSFQVWAIESNDTQSVYPDSNPTGGFSDSLVTITEVWVQGHTAGEPKITPVDISGLAVGGTMALAYGMSVTKNADGSVTFSGVEQGDTYGIGTGTNTFNAVDVQDVTGKFDLGIFSLTHTDQGNPIDMSFGVTATDHDGDTSTGAINVSLVPTAQNNAAAVNTLMATNSVSTNTSSDHLVSTNDNHRVFEEHRPATNAALLGAVAAAGLSQAEQLAAHPLHAPLHALHSGPIMAPDMLPNTQFAVRDSGSGASVQPTHIVAPDHVAGSAHLSSQANAASLHGLVGQDHGGHQVVTQLLGATDGHVMSHGPAPLTSAAIAIPPAQLLAAHIGAGKGGVEGGPNATTVIHSNGTVGHVLADALAGGHSNGPNIDALLHHAAGHGHGSANDALASLASHDAAGVSNGHSGVFAGFHGAPVMEHMMMHQDAVPAHS